MLTTCDIVLVCLTLIIATADIILALCLRLILPDYITQVGYYPDVSDGKKHSLEEAAYYCPCVRRAISLSHNSSQGKAKRSADFSTDQLDKYPFLVSLSIPAYTDDLDHQIFACNGLIQSADWLLTSEACVKEKSEWYNLTVRSGSAYWSSFGEEHVVVDVSFRGGGLVTIKVSPSFAEELVPDPAIQYPFSGDWFEAVTLGWDDDMYTKPIAFRRKYEVFEIDEWTKKFCGSESTDVCLKSKSCKLASKPLLTDFYQLIAMKVLGGHDCGDFSRLREENEDLQDKGCYKVYKKYCLNDEIYSFGDY